MIRFINQHIIDSKDEIVVCPCNCLGEFGIKSGVSRSFKIHENFFKYYKANCKARRFKIGSVVSWDTGNYDCFPRSIWLVPTKNHWRDGSYLEWVKAGLEAISSKANEEMVVSLGIPLLGCDFKGLEKKESKDLIIEYLREADILINVYKKGCGNDVT